MRIGVMLPMSRSDGPGRMPGWPDVRALASHAESAGLDSVWVCDHLLSEPPGERPEGVLEGWTVLAALAASTRRVTLGTLDIVGRLLDGAVVDSARFHRLRARLAAMTRALAAAGREPDSLRVTVGMSVEDGSPDELARAVDGYAALGVDDLIVGLTPRTERSVDVLVRALALRSGR